MLTKKTKLTKPRPAVHPPPMPESWERDERIDNSTSVVFRTLTGEFRRLRDAKAREKTAEIEKTQHLIDKVTFDLKSSVYKEDILMPKILWKPSFFSLSTPEILERSCKHCGAPFARKKSVIVECRMCEHAVCEECCKNCLKMPGTNKSIALCTTCLERCMEYKKVMNVKTKFRNDREKQHPLVTYMDLMQQIDTDLLHATLTFKSKLIDLISRMDAGEGLSITKRELQDLEAIENSTNGSVQNLSLLLNKVKALQLGSETEMQVKENARRYVAKRYQSRMTTLAALYRDRKNLHNQRMNLEQESKKQVGKQAAVAAIPANLRVKVEAMTPNLCSTNTNAFLGGQNFPPSMTISIGGIECTAAFCNPSLFFVTIPALPRPGLYSVTVSTPDGQTSTLPNAFSYTKAKLDSSSDADLDFVTRTAPAPSSSSSSSSSSSFSSSSSSSSSGAPAKPKRKIEKPVVSFVDPILSPLNGHAIKIVGEKMDYDVKITIGDKLASIQKYQDLPDGSVEIVIQSPELPVGVYTLRVENSDPSCFFEMPSIIHYVPSYMLK